MLRSIPLLEGGTLVAVAAQDDLGWFLVALDPRLEDLDRKGFRDAAATERAARAALRRDRARPAAA